MTFKIKKKPRYCQSSTCKPALVFPIFSILHPHLVPGIGEVDEENELDDDEDERSHCSKVKPDCGTDNIFVKAHLVFCPIRDGIKPTNTASDCLLYFIFMKQSGIDLEALEMTKKWQSSRECYCVLCPSNEEAFNKQKFFAVTALQ